MADDINKYFHDLEQLLQNYNERFNNSIEELLELVEEMNQIGFII